MANPFKGLGGNKGPLGGMGGLGDLSKLLEVTQQKMMGDAEKMQEMLEETRIEGTAGGAVKATVDGHGSVVAISIAQEAVDPSDVATLEEMVLTALTQAQEKAAELREEEQKKLMSGLPQIPGMKLPF